MKFGDSMKDTIKTRCQICKNFETLVNMRSGVRNRNKINISEYHQKYSSLLEHMVEHNAVSALWRRHLHVKGQDHGVHKEYSTKYLTRQRPGHKRTPVQKSSTDVSAENSSEDVDLQKSCGDIPTKTSFEDLQLWKNHKSSASEDVSHNITTLKKVYHDLSTQELLAQVDQLILQLRCKTPYFGK